MNKNNYKKLIKWSSLFLALSLLVTFFISNAFNFNDEVSTEKQPKFSNIRIYAVNDQDMQKIVDAGLIIEAGMYKPGRFMDTWLSEDEIKMLQASGVPYEVLVDDWDTYYKNQPKMTEADYQKQIESFGKNAISHNIYGSMGGYLTYAEVVSKLDSMRLQYPTLISAKWSIGTTYENRTIWAVRITKNPDAPTGRPEALYHALIHAREPESMEQQMYFFYWLFENYNTNPIARYILNNREIYWIPVFNADGYEYNHTTNPSGGGMWRTNRHMTTSGCGYTDINRNYGLYQFWNSTNNGSSTNACSGGQGTYRGPSPFSELETAAMKTFVDSRNFNSGYGAHTFGNYQIKPYCWNDPLGSPNDAQFNMILADLKSFNATYTTGFPSQTVGYKVRGGADDYYYYDSVHSASGHHTFTITPETGPSFWPPQSQILPLAEGMLENNKYMALIAGPYVNYVSNTFNQATYTPGSSGNVKINFRNKGVVIANNTKIILTPGNDKVTIPTQQYIRNVPAFSPDSATFNFTVAANAPNNCYVPCNLTIKQDTATIYSSGIFIKVGNPTFNPIFTDLANNFNFWTTDGTWGTTTSSYYSAPSSFTESPSGNYGNNLNISMTYFSSLNVASYPVCQLSFWHKYAVETNWDYCYVEVSSDNGGSYKTVATYTGTLASWTQVSIDITPYLSAPYQLKLRFRFTSDDNTTYDGWYIDNIVVSAACVGSPVGVEPNSNTPLTFALAQNFPNPFNPSTVIKYQIPKTEIVTIKLYDITGKLVTTLVNEKKDAGYYDVTFDGTNFASGAYFYKIEAGSFVDTKKMILVK